PDVRSRPLHHGVACARPSQGCSHSGWLSAGALPPARSRFLPYTTLFRSIGLDEPTFLWRRLVGAPAPGANSVARLLARWTGSPAAPIASSSSTVRGLHPLGFA